MRYLWIFVCAMLLALPIGAQEDETIYDDPFFTIPIPQGWTNMSTEAMAHFINPEETVNLYAFAVVDGDVTTLATIIFPEFTGASLQSSPVPLGMLTWTQDIYLLPIGKLLAVIHYTDDAGVVYVLAVEATQNDLPPVVPVLNEVLLNFVIKSVDTTTPPAPYDMPENYNEQEVIITTDRWQMSGILSLPIGDGLFPAVVIVHGSGPSDRDGTVNGVNKPYRDLAQGLASNGIAVLRYDKRTLVYGADSSDDMVTLTLDDETINDALSAIALLRNIPQIDPSRIYVIGHSLGGMTTPRIAERDGALAGGIIMAGNSRSLIEVVLEQFDYLQALPINSAPETQTMLNDWREEILTIQQLTPDADPNQLLFGAFVPYWLDILAYNQVEMAQNLEIPLLILQGERDYQVTMTDFALWQSGLADKPNVTFISYPTLNHLFLAGEGQSTPAEYAIPSHIPEEVINDIVNWIQR